MSTYQETTVNQLRRILDQGVVRFNFKKLDGSIRNALGTRNPDLVPKDECIKLIDDISNKSTVYFDLEVKEFRSMSNSCEVAVL